MTKSTDAARLLFKINGLTYRDIDKKAIARLEYEIADAMLKNLGTITSMSLDDEKKIVWANAGIKEAYLTVSGTWFQVREAISFNEDGFIGFAGWADNNNFKPLLVAFKKWVKWLTKSKGIAD